MHLNQIVMVADSMDLASLARSSALIRDFLRAFRAGPIEWMIHSQVLS